MPRVKQRTPRKRPAPTRMVPAPITELKQPPPQLQVTSDVLLGRYSNVAVINHTKREFTFDFIFVVGNQGSVVARIATSPAHAKRFLEVLGKNLVKYERTFGRVETDE